MTFGNWGMLFGLVALAVPILIHLLNRSRATVLDWGAMRFLLASLTSQNRRLLIEEIILLVLRCLLVALVVLAMARPFLPSRTAIPWAVVLPAFLAAVICLAVAGAMWAHRKARWALLAVALALAVLAGGASVNENIVQQLKWAAGKGETDVALLIDASLSMSVKIEGKTNFQRAIAEARAVVAACEPGDSVSLFLAGPVPRPIIATPTADREEIARALERLAPMGGTMGVLEALNVAAASLAEGDNAAEKVVLITDGQNVGWDVRSRARWRFLAEGLKELPTAPRIICRILPLPKRFRNVAVADVTFSRKVVGPDRPVKIHVKVMNTGTVTAKPQAVELSVDGAKVATEKIVTEILPKASETLTFEHKFTRSGPRLVSARVVMADDIPQDNTSARVLDVIEELAVLIVDGTPSPLPLAGAGDFIEIALTPRDENSLPNPPPKGEGATLKGEGVDFLVKPTVVPAPDIAKVENLHGYAAIVLANVPRLPDAVARKLIRFVQNGGGLLIAPGTRAKPTFYGAWAPRAAAPVVPARLAERRSAAEDPERLAPRSFSHPALQLLADTKQSDVEAALVKSYWKLEADEKDPAVRVGGRLQSGEPFLVERKLGKGYVLLLATALDPASSNLPTLKSFVPLCHELVYYLASPMMLDPNVAPGSEVTLELRGAARGAAKGTGLRAVYYDAVDFSRLKVDRIDPTVNFDWGADGPHPDVASETFSVRWRGWVQPLYSERYTFHAVADDGVRLRVSGKTLIEAWRDQDATEHSGSIALAAGRRYKVEMDYYEDSGNAVAKLLWSSPSQRKQVIPQSQLYPASLSLAERPAVASGAPEGAERQGAEVVTPSGRRLPARLIESDGTLRVSFTETQEPGLYTLRLPPGVAETYASSSDGKGLPFVVLSKVEESLLERLSDADLDLAGQHVDLFETERTDEMTSAVTGGVPGEELWKYLAIGALLTLLGEIAITRWVAIQRRLGAVETVVFGAEAVDVQTFRERAKQLLVVPQPQAKTGVDPG